MDLYNRFLLLSIEEQRQTLAVLMDAAERWLDYSSCVCKSCGPQHCLPCLVRAALARLKLKDERV